MLHDKLKLNAEKTEFLVIGTKRQLDKVNITQLHVAGSSVNTSTTAIKNLGSWFDSHLNMQDHIKKTCSSSFYNIYNIRRIRKYLTRDVTESLVNALVTSKLDYCNSLLYGIANVHLSKLQRVQNAAARLIVGLPRYSSITPVLFSLHWLPVRFRVNFKVLLLTFKCLHCLAPKYLSDLVSVITPTRYNLRRHKGILLCPASAKCKITLGDRAFQSAAPKLWNELPIDLRQETALLKFKTLLKTHLFKLAFNN
jgi:hypothetical protein